MKKLIPAFMLLLSTMSVFGQSYSIKGVVTDTAARQKLTNATVTILNSKDSILYEFSRTEADGSFNIPNLAPGNFLLLVTYHDYADGVRTFTLDAANPVKDFGQIGLTLKATLLKEIVITGAAITIRGDTTVFNAGSYKVQANDRVEDLLKQMPGLTVDQDGKITAQGVAVGKVLVDGEEFFSSDPVLVTRNIRADMVKSIELYDKKSDQAAFTGQNDPNKVKTLNVVLKDEARNSYFGKIDAGGGNDNYYQEQGMYNNFKPKKKWAAYGVMSNTTKAGLAASDNTKFGLPNQNSATYGGQGLPETSKGGLHFDTKYNKDKETLNLNYSYTSQGVKALVNNLSQNNLPSINQFNNSNENRDNKDVTHRFDVAYAKTINPTTRFTFNGSGSFINNRNINDFLSTTTNPSNVLINHSDRRLNNDLDNKTGNFSAFFSKRFKKKGRSFSGNLYDYYRQSSGSRYLYTAIDFYSTGKLDSTRIVDQYKPVDNKNNNLQTYFNWTEPLSKTWSLQLNSSLSLVNSTNNQESFNKSSSGVYNVRDNVYSNNFSVDQLGSGGGVMFSYTKEKNSLSLGTDLSAVRYKQQDLNSTKIYNRHFINLQPQLNYAHTYSQSSTLRFEYFGFTNQPSIDQIQPVRVNTDPLNITIGNENLKPAFLHYGRVNYLSSKQLSGQSISITALYNPTYRNIVNYTVTSPTGITTTQWVNLDKVSHYLQGDVTIGNKLKKSGINISSNINTTGQYMYNYINGVLNKSMLYTFNFYSIFSKTQPGKYDFNVRMGPGYNLQTNSVSKGTNNNSLVLRFEPAFNIFLPGKTQIGSTGSYLYRQKTDAFLDDYSALIWNLTLSKKFLKKDNLVISMYGNDLFNQNLGFTRSSPYSNAYTETRFNTIRRYYMLQVAWDFVKPMAKPAAAPAQK